MPALLLQPLVENAIKHGISPSLRGGELRIVARVESEGRSEWLTVEVNDTGVGVNLPPRSPGAELKGGVGLENVRRRLSGIYGDQASFAFSSRADFGTNVAIRIPVIGPAVDLTSGPAFNEDVTA